MAQLFNKKAEAAAVILRLFLIRCRRLNVHFLLEKGFQTLIHRLNFFVLIYIIYLQLLKQALFTFQIYFIKIIIYRDDGYVERWLLVLNQQRQAIFVPCQVP